MLFSVRTHLSYTTERPCDVLLQIEAASDAAQECRQSEIVFTPDVSQRGIDGEDGVGTRRWLQAGPVFDCRYEAVVNISRPASELDQLVASATWQSPNDVTKYLMPSRYCHPEAFFELVPAQFGHLSGGSQVSAMSDWIRTNFTYDNGASDAATTATESFASRAGVCRDYAHVLIAMVRAAGIPARFVSAYAPEVTPQDFHAVVEVYLSGSWHLVDPTGMSRPPEIIRIGVGRDAADVSFMTSYGWMELKKQSVEVLRVA